LALLQCLARQVQALHRSGQIHRAIGIEQVTIDQQGQPQLPPSVGPRRFGGDQSDPEFCPPELAQGSVVELPAEIDAAAAILRQREMPLDPRRIDIYQLGVLLCQLLTGEPFLNYLYSPTCKAKVPPMARAVLESCLGENGTGPLMDCDALAAALDALIRQLPEKQATSALETPRSGSVVVGPNDTPPRGGAVVPRAKPTADEKLPFQQLGHFQIVGRIGSGGMGDVYQGYDASLDRYVAIKVLAAPLARDEAFVRRFSAEATAAAKVSHPNVVPIYFIGQDAEHHFFAMQLIDGQSLAQRLAREKRLPIDEAITIVKQCLAGLGAAHAQGLIHRDVKPGNILLERAGDRAMLVDFGLARHLNASTRMTVTGVIMGTVDYLAPEQARGRAIDGRTDIYSLGVMFYELLAGRLPFLCDSPTAMIFQHAYELPFPLKQAAPEVPQPLVDIVARMMAKEPDDRYASCAAVLADLRAFREGRPVGAVILSVSADEPTARLEAEQFLLPFPSENPWQRARDWAATIFRRYAPEYVQEMQGTTMQMDAAVAEYQRRRDRLAKLLKEALSLEGQLPQEQVEDLQEQLTKADATLASLRSQQNVLKARLQAAEARRQLEDGLSRPRRRRWLVAMLISAFVGGVLAFMGAVLFVMYQRAESNRAHFPIEIAKPIAEQPAAVKTAVLGCWDIVRETNNGKLVSQGPGFDRICWFYENGVIDINNVQPLENVITGRYVMEDGAFQPKKITISRYHGKEHYGKDLLGIYKFEGERLYIAYCSDRPRPEKFESISGSGVTLLVLEKSKPRIQPLSAASGVASRPEFARDVKLNKTQRQFRDWTENYFKGFFSQPGLQNLNPQEKAVKEEELLRQLSSDDSDAEISAINALAVLGSKQAVSGLLQIAAERRVKDNRDRWMAIRALGMIGDPSVVPELVHLTYHYNKNARLWAQISLVRLTGENFGDDVVAWKGWWEKQGGTPPISEQRIDWKTSGSAEVSQPAGVVSTTVDGKLNATQRRLRDVCEKKMKGFLDQSWLQRLDSPAKAVEEEKALAKLLSDDWNERILAINVLACLDSKKAVPGLLQIAADRSMKDNCDRWMAVRALGIIGNQTVVPDLVHLTYHYNIDTQLWAQISLVRLTGKNFGDNVAAWKGWWENQGGTPPISEHRIDWEASGSADASQPAGVVPSEQQAFIIGNSPYWQRLSDMARQKGMTVGKLFNTQYDEFLPLAKGHVLFIETHDGIPIVPLPVLEKFYPKASEGLKTPEGTVNIGNTKIVFVDFSRLRN
jgi:uncharacterized protein (TIGR03067 family)